MNRTLFGAAVAASVAFGAALAQEKPTEEVQGRLVDTGGQQVGEVTVRETGGGLLIRIEAMGLPPGPHGMHLHAIGRCDSLNGFEAAGDHIAGAEQAHGLLHGQPHDGDLPNLFVGEDGSAIAEVEVVRLPMRGAHGSLLDPDGSALVIHAHEDDQASPDGGNSGARIACAELEAPDDEGDLAE